MARGKITTAKVAVWAGVAALVVLLVMAILGPLVAQLGAIVWPEEPEPVEPPGYALTLPIELTVRDQLTGGAIDGATVNILSPDGRTLEAGVTDAVGKYTTVHAYSSGSQLFVEVVKGNLRYQVPITVPRAETEVQTKYLIGISLKQLGSYAISVIDPEGRSIPPGGVYNVTETGNIYPTFTVMVRNALDNTGFQSFRDIRTGRLLEQAVVVDVTGRSFVRGWALLYQVGPFDKTYVEVLMDDALDRIRRPDGTYERTGVMSLPLSVDASMLTAGDSDTYTITLYLYIDVSFWRATGVANVEALSAATFNFSVAA